MASRKWIITGGAGFIGANTAATLMQTGVHPVLLDNLSRPSAPLNLEWLRSLGGDFTFVRADIRDRAAVSAAFRQHADADTVLHLAAQVAVTTSVVAPRDDFEINAVGTFEVLEAVRGIVPDAAFLYVSTNKVYGDLGLYRTEERATRWELVDFPAGIDENIPLDPHSPYGCSKATGEAYALDYARVYGLKTVSLRQSCIYGPRQFGIEDQGWVAWFALAAALGRQITIFGDGKQVRDLLYVDDLVELYLEAAERAVDCAGRAYNVGGGAGNTLSLVELIEILEERYGALEPRFAPLRAGDQRVFVADSGRAAADLGWRPTTPVASGLDQLLEWVGEHAEPARALLTAG